MEPFPEEFCPRCRRIVCVCTDTPKTPVLGIAALMALSMLVGWIIGFIAGRMA